MSHDDRRALVAALVAAEAPNAVAMLANIDAERAARLATAETHYDGLRERIRQAHAMGTTRCLRGCQYGVLYGEVMRAA